MHNFIYTLIFLNKIKSVPSTIPHYIQPILIFLKVSYDQYLIVFRTTPGDNPNALGFFLDNRE